jgi:F-type H+-transporting ATPase subunit b
MPAFLSLEFWSIANPELWVAIGLIVFLAIIFMTGAHNIALGSLDQKAKAIQDNLDEAERLRKEAEAMLVEIRAQREAAEAQGKAMLAEAKLEAKRLEAEAKARLEDTIARRTALADRRIATAEAQATQDVKSAAADLAASMAEQVLSSRIAKAKSDPLVDKALSELAGRLQ